MTLKTTGSVLVVFLLSLTVVLGQGDWDVTYYTQSICVLKGSTVELSCTYKYPSGYKVTSTFWFTKVYPTENYVNLLDDPDYTGRVTYHNINNNHTLIITDLRESDSAEYKFRLITDQPEVKWIGTPGVTLSFPGLQVEVTGGDMKTLTCRHCPPPSNPNPTYIWYKNGQQIDESSSPQYKDPVSSNNEDSYSCSVKGHEDLHSSTLCVQGQDCNRVTYTKRRICVLKGSSVDISCTYVGYYSVRSSLWFSPKQSGRWRDKLKPEDLTTDPGYAGRVKNKNEKSGKKGSTLRITDLREEDSAEYRFTFKTYYLEWGHDFPGTTLTVTDVVLEMPTSVSEGNRVTLTCTTNCSLDPNPEYSWHKNGQPIENTNTNSTVHILSVSSEDAGRYSCGVKGHETLLSPEKTLDVTYGPKYTSVSLSPSGEIVVGSSVTLTCSSDANPPVNKYTWYKKTVTSPKASGQNYNITNIRPEDSGEYYCEAENKYGRLNSFSVSVDVHYGPRNTSVLISPSGEIVVGSSVTLTCSSDANPPVDKYTWYKKNVNSPKASGQRYSITNITSEDSGEYYCEAHNRKGTKNSTALMLIIAVKLSSVLTSSVGITVFVLVLILCVSGFIWFKRKNVSKSTSSDKRNTRDTEDNGQSVHSDPDSDTYTTLNMKTRSPEYDTLSVHPDTNNDMYSSLNMKARSPDYDTLVCSSAVASSGSGPGRKRTKTEPGLKSTTAKPGLKRTNTELALHFHMSII